MSIIVKEIHNTAFDGKKVIERSIFLNDGKYDLWITESIGISNEFEVGSTLKDNIFQISFSNYFISSIKETYYRSSSDNSFLFDGSKFIIGEFNLIPIDDIRSLEKDNYYTLEILYIRLNK